MKKWFVTVAFLALAVIGSWWYLPSNSQSQGAGSEAVEHWLKDFSQLASQRYSKLAQSAAALHKESQAFCDNHSERDFVATQSAWKTFNTDYARVEAISFGPLSSSGEGSASRKQRLKIWPAQGHNHKVERAVDQLIAADSDITAAALNKFPTQFQSLDALEYLLFGSVQEPRDAQCFSGGDKAACDAQRSCDFLLASSTNLSQLLNSVEREWREDFALSLANAGSHSSLYLDQTTAVGDIVNGIKSHLILLRNKKVRDPLNSGYAVADPKSLEAWRSQHSLALLSANLNSLGDIYAGNGPSGSERFGLKDLLLAGGFQENAERFQSALQHTQQQLDALKPLSLYSQLSGEQPDKTAMMALYKSLFALSESYALDVIQPLPIQNSFNEFDGD